MSPVDASPQTASAGEKDDEDAGRFRGLRRRQAILIALALVVLIDVGFGVVARRLSAPQLEAADIRRMGQEVSASEGPVGLLIGTTVVSGQIDADRLDTQLARNGQVLTTSVVPIADGEIAVWAAAYDQHFARAGGVPEAVIIAFVGDQLNDKSRVDWSSIGQLHTSWRSLPARVRSAPDLNSKLLLAGSRVSSLLGNREWPFDVLSDLVPGFSSVPRTEPAVAVEQKTFTRLADLVSAADADGARVVVVALPTARSYDVPEDIPRVVTGAGGGFIDLRQPSLFTEDRFTSSASLTPGGSRLLTDQLAARLIGLIDER